MGSQVHNRDSGTIVGILKREAQLFCRSWVLVLGVVGLHDGSEGSRRFKAEIGEFLQMTGPSNTWHHPSLFVSKSREDIPGVKRPLQDLAEPAREDQRVGLETGSM